MGCSAFLFSGAAYAGFEWTPPAPGTETAAEEPLVVKDYIEEAEKESRALSDVIWRKDGTGSDQVETPMSIRPDDAGQATDVDDVPVREVKSMTPFIPRFPGVEQADAQPTLSPMPAGQVIAQGFGSDIPLAMAIQQIIPEGYVYVFGAGVNPSTAVTWQGGKEWGLVLADVLRSQNLRYFVVGKRVNIVPCDGACVQQAVAQRTNVGIDSMKTMEKMVKRYGGNVATQQPAPVPVAAMDAFPPIQNAQQDFVAPTPTPAPAQAVWQADRGQSLRLTLESWADEADVKLLWYTDSDFVVPAPLKLEGSFTDAVSEVLRSFSNLAPRPKGEFYPDDPAQGPVLVIVNS